MTRLGADVSAAYFRIRVSKTKMARIALIAGIAIAGAVISVATGGLGTFEVGAWAADIIAGASVGAAVGSVLSNIIFPPNTNTAPPLNDLQSQSSAYGSPIAWGYGSYRIAAQVIWADTIKVHKSQQSQGGGKGGGPTSTVYTYTISAMLSFGFGPGSITRVWADSKLVYDKTGKGPIAIDTGLSNSNGSAITTPFFPTFYNGTPNDPPDPTVQALQGIGATSGYRDQIKMVLTDFPLADYGNRLPNFRCEITTSTGLNYVADYYPGSFIPSPDGNGTSGPSWVSVDVINRVAWVQNLAGTVVQRIDLDVNQGDPADPYQFDTLYNQGDQVLDVNGNIQLCTVTHTSRNDGMQPPWATGFGVGTQHDGDGDTFVWINMGPGPNVQPITLAKALDWPVQAGHLHNALNQGLIGGADTAGNFWIQGEQGTNAGGGIYSMLRFNPNTLVNDRQVPIPYLAPMSGLPIGPYYFTGMTFVKSAASGKNYAYFVGQYNKMFTVMDCDAGTFPMMATWDSGTANDIAQVNAAPVVDPVTGTAYLCLDTHVSTPKAAIGVINTSGGSAIANIITIDPSWEVPGDVPASFFWDGNDSTLIMLSQNGAVVKINPKTGAVIAQLPAHTVTSGGSVAQYMCKAYNGLVPGDGILRLIAPSGGTHAILYLQTSDLTVTQSIPLGNWLAAINNDNFTSYAYDVLANDFIAAGGTVAYSQTSARIYLDRQATAEQPLSDVVADIWARTGADPADLDVSALAAIQVKGYPITQQSTGKGILGPLMAAYFFDLVESDNVLKAVVRGSEVTTIIPETDLGLEKDKFEANPTVVQENDLPLVMDVLYADKDQQYQQGKQTYRRPKTIKKTRNRSQISLPLTLQGDDAIAIATRCLQTAWAERNQWEFKLWRMSYLTIDPTDVVQFTYQGKVYQSRIGKTAVGQDKTMEITAVSEDPRQYVATPPPGVALGFKPGLITAISQTTTFILDTNLIQDTDSGATGNTGYYWAMASRANHSTWPGATLMQSLDNNTFSDVDVDTTPVIYGDVLAATPAPPTLYAWDYVTKLSVVMANGGTLSSDTPLNVLNGSNWFLLNGELMAFANATLQTDGITYILDTLLRGLRGTEQACYTHQTTETFIRIDNAIQRQIVPTSLIAAQQYFRGITFGQPATSAASTPVTLQGNDLKPYAPAQLKGTRS